MNIENDNHVSVDKQGIQYQGDFSQRIYHLASLFVRLLRCYISCVARYVPDIAP